MRQVIYAVGVSLDGYLAAPDGGVDWLEHLRVLTAPAAPAKPKTRSAKRRQRQPSRAKTRREQM